jgi:hypothetical protein
MARRITVSSARIYEHNDATGHTPNQILYGFNAGWKLSVLSNDETSDFAKDRDIIRMDVANAIDFANAKAKIMYDGNHRLMTFNTGDRVYLRLHHGYSLPEKGHPKLSNQRSGPYTIKRKIGNAAYELDLPSTSRIQYSLFLAKTWLAFLERILLINKPFLQSQFQSTAFIDHFRRFNG